MVGIFYIYEYGNIVNSNWNLFSILILSLYYYEWRRFYYCDIEFIVLEFNFFVFLLVVFLVISWWEFFSLIMVINNKVEDSDNCFVINVSGVIFEVSESKFNYFLYFLFGCF